ncbi:MAG: RND family efflux transporter MFP subunit [Candidatus Azotimanducaceae bacterium]|jgi:RND family efflux transporter MFP subunit
MKQLVITVIVVVFGVANMAMLMMSGPKLDSKPTVSLAPLVRVVTVNPETVQMTANTHGTVAPRTESELTPEVSGRVVAVSSAMVSGGFFKKGEVLLTIEPLDYELALIQAKASLARAESEVNSARRANSRQVDLQKKDLTSDSQSDDALNRFRVAEATLLESKARLAKAERDLERTELVAPYDGRVRAKQVDVGQFVNRGNPVAMIYAIDYVEVRLPIKDQELEFVNVPLAGNSTSAEQQLAGVRLKANFGGAQYQWLGEVVRTEGEIDPQTRMINVVARVSSPFEPENKKPPLSIGLFVSAEIQGQSFDDVVVLPRIALRGKSQVYVVDAQNRLQFRDVVVLREVEDQIYIKGGLQAGERVCISPLEIALDGMMVRVPNPGKEVALR